MKAVRTDELKAGDFAALIMDMPNVKGIEVMRQGTIEKIEPADMYGTYSETLQLIYFKPRGGDDWSTQVITVNNSHLWLVRTY